jgi:hypothetical protein
MDRRLAAMNRLLIGAIAVALVAGPAFADEARFEECRGKLKAAAAIGFLRDLRVKGESTPKIVVSPTWQNVDFDVKEGLVRTVDCFLMTGDDSKRINLDILDSRTNQRIARWRYGVLTVEE